MAKSQRSAYWARIAVDPHTSSGFASPQTTTTIAFLFRHNLLPIQIAYILYISEMSQNPPTFVVEHLDPELGPWSALEYACIARESHATGARFMLSSVSPSLQLPADLAATQGLEVDQRSVEEIFADRKSKVCLLDPAAKEELSPADGQQFEVFLFGGILGTLSTYFIGHIVHYPYLKLTRVVFRR